MPSIKSRADSRLQQSTYGDRNPTPGNKTSSGESEFNDPPSIYDILPSGSRSRDVYLWVDKVLREKTNRRGDYDLFDKMDHEFPEIASALDIYADNATQVGVTRADASRGNDHIVQIVTADDDLRVFLEEMRDRLRLDNRAWSLARDLAKMGEVFEEIVVTEDLELDRLKHLPAPYMIRNEDDYGILEDPNAFIQVDETYTNAVARFQPWEVAHFRLQRRNEDRYGRSILHPVRRAYRQLQMIEDSMVVARLTRATTKYVYKVDTGGMPAPLAKEYVDKIKAEHKKRRIVDPQTGQLREDMNPMGVEEDIFLGISKGSQAGVEQLYGDLNLGNLEDVYYFRDKLFGGIKIPKSYLGIEKDVNAKATLSQQDIQFARTVRRVQLAMRIGYNHIFDVALALEGTGALAKQAAMSRYSVALPTMQTVDEMREWEVTRIQSEVARIWAQELYLDPVQVYTMLLGMSEQQATKLFQGSSSEFNKIEINKNAAKSSAAQQDKKFSQKVKEAIATDDRSGDQVLADLRMLAEWQLEQIEQEEMLNS